MNRRRPIKGGKISVSAMNKLLNETYKKKDATASNIDNKYFLDTDLSTDKTKVYIDTSSGEVIIANRGTSDFKDVMTDAKLLFGFKDKSRFGEARDILNKVKIKYPNYSIDTIGHSLGSTVAEDIGRDERVKNVITLNKPVTPKDLISKQKTDKQIDIRTTGDIVSALQPLQKDTKDIVIQSETRNPYTEHKIDTLDRLNQDMILGTGFKSRKDFHNHFINLVLIEYMKLIE